MDHGEGDYKLTPQKIMELPKICIHGFQDHPEWCSDCKIMAGDDREKSLTKLFQKRKQNLPKENNYIE